MRKVLKALHLIGLAAFFGSILSHVSTSFIPGAMTDPETTLVVRQAIGVATTYLTLPALALLVVTGALLAVVGKWPLPRTRWLVLHAIFGLLIVLNAAFVLYPGGQALSLAAADVAAGTRPMDQLLALKGRESAFGAANVLLSLAAVFVAVIKPGLGRTKA